MEDVLDMTVWTPQTWAEAIASSPFHLSATYDGDRVRALIDHARDGSAAAFYARHGFEASPTDALHRVLLMKHLRASLAE